MKLSVVIPLYNNVQYLQKCVDSLSLQQIEKSDFEIIIIDDGSTDGSAELADRIACSCENMRVIHQDNSGSGVARNVGLDAARGEYIHFLDADDQVMPGAYKFLFDNALAVAPDIVYFSSGVNCYSENYICRGSIIYSGSTRNYTKTNHIRPQVWLKLFRVKYLQTHHLRLPDIHTRQDVVFTWDMMRYEGKIIVTDAKLYSYSINNNGATYSRNTNHVKMTVYDLITVNFRLKEFSVDYTDSVSAKRVFNYYYHVLFNRILFTPFSFFELRHLFSLCAQIGIVHLGNNRFYKYIDFLYHNSSIYYLFQYLIRIHYLRRQLQNAGDKGDLIDHRLRD